MQDILGISRIDAGRVEMEPRPAAVSEFSAAVFASHHAPARERGSAALVDPRRLTRVPNELVENAILFTSRGGTAVICTGMQETVCTI